MTRAVLAIVPLSVLFFAAHVEADDHHKAWFKYLRGDWTYEWKTEVGDFAEKGTVKWRPRAKGNALIGSIATDKKAQEVEIAGWNATSKTLTFTGFSSHGGSWHIPYTDVTTSRLESKTATGVTPDGEEWKAESFVLEKKSEDEFELHSKGTAGGKPLISTATFKRMKNPAKKK